METKHDWVRETYEEGFCIGEEYGRQAARDSLRNAMLSLGYTQEQIDNFFSKINN